MAQDSVRVLGVDIDLDKNAAICTVLEIDAMQRNADSVISKSYAIVLTYPLQTLYITYRGKVLSILDRNDDVLKLRFDCLVLNGAEIFEKTFKGIRRSLLCRECIQYLIS